MAPPIGPGIVLVELVRLVLALLVSVGFFYLLIKLAGLVDAMTKAKQASQQSAGHQAHSGSVTS